jgi:hypothetical protein
MALANKAAGAGGLGSISDFCASCEQLSKLAELLTQAKLGNGFDSPVDLALGGQQQHQQNRSASSKYCGHSGRGSNSALHGGMSFYSLLNQQHHQRGVGNSSTRLKFTVFAPTNAAWAALPVFLKEFLLGGQEETGPVSVAARKAALRDTLAYHLLPSEDDDSGIVLVSSARASEGRLDTACRVTITATAAAVEPETALPLEPEPERGDGGGCGGGGNGSDSGGGQSHAEGAGSSSGSDLWKVAKLSLVVSEGGVFINGSPVSQ